MLAAVLFLLLGASGDGKMVSPFVDKNFAGIITVGESHLPDFEKLHGKGTSFDHGSQRCYYQPQANQYLTLVLCEDYNLILKRVV